MKKIIIDIEKNRVLELTNETLFKLSNHFTGKKFRQISVEKNRHS